MRRQRFYQITTSGRTADITIYGNISSIATDLARWYGSDENVAEVSSYGIQKDIQGLDVDLINIYINSYGGEVAEALAIYSALKRHKATVHTYCDGFACSAATIVFCAGDQRTMGSIALMMVHNCMSYVGYANAGELRKAAEDTDKINESSINAYKAVAAIDEGKIRELMDAETWLTADECLEYGFATDIADMEEGDRAQQSAFRLIRQAVLDARPRADYGTILERLVSIERRVEALGTKPEPDPGPVDTLVPDKTAMEKARIFFTSMFKKED